MELKYNVWYKSTRINNTYIYLFREKSITTVEGIVINDNSIEVLINKSEGDSLLKEWVLKYAEIKESAPKFHKAMSLIFTQGNL